MKTLSLMICAGLLGSVTFAATAQPAAVQAPASSVATRVAALNALLAEQWQYTLQNSPEFATILGDLRYNDRLTDRSPEAIVASDGLRAAW